MFKNLSTSVKLWLLGVSAVITVLLICAVGILAISGLSAQTHRDLDTARSHGEIMIVIKQAQSSFLVQIQEWKNILIRGNDPESFSKHMKSFKENGEAAQNYLGKGIELARQAKMDSSEIETLKKNHASLNERYLNAIAQFDSANPQAGKVVDNTRARNGSGNRKRHGKTGQPA